MAEKQPRVIVVGDEEKPNVPDAVERALPLLREHADVAMVDLDGSHDLEAVRADLLFVFGGDGAILKTVRRLGSNHPAVCGVNLGKLGFLATVTCDDFDGSLPSILAGAYRLLTPRFLRCRVRRDGETLHESRAVNDVVVSRGALSRIVRLDLLIDRETVTTYNGDGLIVSTPLGSTAHSLSAGGPIVEPGVEALILTPICPHTLSNRPLVVPADRTIELGIGEGPEGVALTVDGQVFQPLQVGDQVSVTASDERFRLARAPGCSYYGTLRDKLGWSGHLGS
jgi:NAD+ kinase